MLHPPDGVASTETDPLRHWPVLVHLLREDALDLESLVCSLQQYIEVTQIQVNSHSKTARVEQNNEKWQALTISSLSSSKKWKERAHAVWRIKWPPSMWSSHRVAKVTQFIVFRANTRATSTGRLCLNPFHTVSVFTSTFISASRSRCPIASRIAERS